MSSGRAIRLTDRSSVAEVRWAALEQARALGWDEVEGGNAALVATELASNVIKHVGEGVVGISSGVVGDDSRLVLLSVDRGPGMSDIDRCFEDGFSTAGSDGSGLGAVARIADSVDVESTPEGTVLVAELRRSSGSGRPGCFSIGALAVPKEGETACGDTWECLEVDGGIAVFASDGLGHGVFAEEASRRGADVFRGSAWRRSDEAMAKIHEALRPTRGAAAAVALIEPSAGRLGYCGVGNISASMVVDDKSRHLVSHNGILGHAARRIVEIGYEWPEGAMLVMHSDGITARWQPARLRSAWHRHPALVAGMLYRDFARGNDDVVVLVVRPE
jgi:anti-sigma regulatory factor (Ser/Thr protein kinase)